MKTLRAHVEGGRVVVDDPVELPDGTVLHLVVADDADDLGPDEREALHEALERSWQSARSDRLVAAEEVLASLRRR